MADIPVLLRGVWGADIQVPKRTDYPADIQQLSDENRAYFEADHYSKSEIGQRIRRMLRFWDEMIRDNIHLPIGSPETINSRYNARSHIILPQRGLLTIALSLDPRWPVPDQFCDVYLQTRSPSEFSAIGARCIGELGMLVRGLREFRGYTKRDKSDFIPPFDPTPSDFMEPK